MRSLLPDMPLTPTCMHACKRHKCTPAPTPCHSHTHIHTQPMYPPTRRSLPPPTHTHACTQMHTRAHVHTRAHTHTHHTHTYTHTHTHNRTHTYTQETEIQGRPPAHPVRLSALVMARPDMPGLVGSTTATHTVVENTMMAPIISSRTLSQRLTTWMGQYARLLRSRLACACVRACVRGCVSVNACVCVCSRVRVRVSVSGVVGGWVQDRPFGWASLRTCG